MYGLGVLLLVLVTGKRPHNKYETVKYFVDRCQEAFEEGGQKAEDLGEVI